MKVEYLLPEVYYRDSRDFAFVGRCFEVIFNYIKTGAQCVNVNYLTDAIDSNVIELMADTVGFTSKHKYQSKNLLAVAGSFQTLLRNKGSIHAVELAVNILMNAQKLSTNVNMAAACEIDPEDPFNLLVYIPDALSDAVLLEDLFEYILPAGMTYNLIRIAESSGALTSDVLITNKYGSVEIVEEDNTKISHTNDDEKAHFRELNIAQIARKINTDT